MLFYFKKNTFTQNYYTTVFSFQLLATPVPSWLCSASSSVLHRRYTHFCTSSSPLMNSMHSLYCTSACLVPVSPPSFSTENRRRNRAIQSLSDSSPPAEKIQSCSWTSVRTQTLLHQIYAALPFSFSLPLLIKFPSRIRSSTVGVNRQGVSRLHKCYQNLMQLYSIQSSRKSFITSNIRKCMEYPLNKTIEVVQKAPLEH